MRVNLLKETIEFLEMYNKTPHDVEFVNDGVHSCNFEQFANVAKDYYYDNGFGLVEVNYNLKIVGEDWYLERDTYDGSECWSFKTIPTRDIPISGCETINVIEYNA